MESEAKEGTYKNQRPYIYSEKEIWLRTFIYPSKHPGHGQSFDLRQKYYVSYCVKQTMQPEMIKLKPLLLLTVKHELESV